MTTAEFIVAHRTDNPRQLALQASRFPDVDMPYAVLRCQPRHRLSATPLHGAMFFGGYGAV